MDAYLETRGALTHTYTASTVFGTLEIQATGRHWVDWGDGTRDGPFSTDGAPWPDGRIVHEYQNVGTYDVTVTTRWTGTWRLAGGTGALPTNQTQGIIEDFPVEQIQAVIIR